jgi:hypothetical protein
LLQGKGAKILVQKLKVTAADQDTNNVADKASSDETNSDQTTNLEQSMVANVCCAIANFATNGEYKGPVGREIMFLQTKNINQSVDVGGFDRRVTAETYDPTTSPPKPLCDSRPLFQ